MHAKFHVSANIIWPCGPGCQQLGPCHYAYGSYNLSAAILLHVGLHPNQLLFHAAQEMLIAKYPPAIIILGFIYFLLHMK